MTESVHAVSVERDLDEGRHARLGELLIITTVLTLPLSGLLLLGRELPPVLTMALAYLLRWRGY